MDDLFELMSWSFYYVFYIHQFGPHGKSRIATSISGLSDRDDKIAVTWRRLKLEVYKCFRDALQFKEVHRNGQEQMLTYQLRYLLN